MDDSGQRRCSQKSLDKDTENAKDDFEVINGTAENLKILSTSSSHQKQEMSSKSAITSTKQKETPLKLKTLQKNSMQIDEPETTDSSQGRSVDDSGRGTRLLQQSNAHTSPNVVTFFMHVCADNANQAARLLVRYPDVLNAVDSELQDGRTALAEAVVRGSLQIAQLLLEKGADPNIPANDGKTALSYAFENNRNNLVGFLLEKGARIDIIDMKGRCPLEYASERDDNPAVARAIQSFLPTLKNNGQLSPGAGHAWTFILTATETYKSEVCVVLDLYLDRMSVLLTSDVSDENSLLYLANSAYTHCIEERLRFLSRYEIQRMEQEYCTNYTKVLFAKDLRDHDRRVVLKFMKFKCQYEKEISIRSNAQLGYHFVPPILAHCNGDIDLSFKEETMEKGLYPYVIVLPAACGSLLNMFSKDFSSLLNDLHSVKSIAKQIVSAVNHFHSKDVIHGDVQPDNILCYDTLYCLADLDMSSSGNSLQRNESKSSPTSTDWVMYRNWKSIVLPPEMLYLDSTKIDNKTVAIRNVPFDEVSGKPLVDGLAFTPMKVTMAHDIWGLGLTLFYLLSGGKHLFNITKKGRNGLDLTELQMIYEWTEKSKQKLLMTVSHPAARDLLDKLLDKNPSKRPSTSEILSHAFFREMNSAINSPTRSVFLTDGISRDDLQTNMKLLGEASRTITEMAKKMAESEQVLVNKENKINELTAEVTRLGVELQKVKERESTNSSKQQGTRYTDDDQTEILSDLINQLKAKDDILADKDKWIADKDDEIADLMDQLGAKDTEVGIREELLDELQDELASTQVKAADKEREAAELSEQVADLTDQLSDLQDELAEKSRWLADMDTQLAERDERLADLVGQLAAGAGAGAGAHDDSSLIEGLKADLDRVGEDLIKRDLEMEKLTKLLAEKDRSCNEKSVLIAEHINTLAEKEKLLTSSGDELAIKVAQIEELQASIKANGNDIEQMTALLIEKEEALGKVNQTIALKDGSSSDLQSRINSLEEELESAKRNLAEAQQEHSEILEQKLQVINDLAQMFQSKDEALDQIIKSVSEKDKVITELQEMLQRKCDELLQFSQETDGLKTRLFEIEKLDSTKSDELASTQVKVADKEREAAELSEQVADLTDQLSNAQKESAEKACWLADLETQLAERSERLVDSDAEIVRLKQLLVEKDEGLATETNKTVSLSQELIDKEAFLQKQFDRMAALENSFRISYEDLEEENQRLRECSTEGTAMNDALARQRREIDHLADHLRKREEELSEKCRWLADKDDQIADLTEQVINKEGTIIQLVDEMSAKESEGFFRDETLAEKEYDATVLSGRVADLHKKLRGMEEELAEKSRWFTEVSCQVAERDERIAELSAQLATAKVAVISSAKPAVTLERELHEKSEQLTKVSRQLTDARRRADDLSAKLEKCQGTPSDGDSKEAKKLIEEKINEVERLSKLLEEKDKRSNEKSSIVAEKNKQLAERMRTIHEKDILLAEKDTQISELTEILASLNPSSTVPIPEDSMGMAATHLAVLIRKKDTQIRDLVDDISKFKNQEKVNNNTIIDIDADTAATTSSLLEKELFESRNQLQVLSSRLQGVEFDLLEKRREFQTLVNELGVLSKVLMAKDKQLSTQSNDIAIRDSQLSYKNMQLTENLKVIMDKDEHIKNMSEELVAKDRQLLEKSVIIAKQETLLDQKTQQLDARCRKHSDANSSQVPSCDIPTTTAVDSNLSDTHLAVSQMEQTESLTLEEQINQKNVELNSLMEHYAYAYNLIGERDIRLAEMEAALSAKDSYITEKEREMNEWIYAFTERDNALADIIEKLALQTQDNAEKSRQLEEKDIRISSLNVELTAKDEIIIEKENQIIVKDKQLHYRDNLISEKDTQLAAILEQITLPEKDDGDAMSSLSEHTITSKSERRGPSGKKPPAAEVASILACFQRDVKDDRTSYIDSQLADMGRKLAEKDKQLATLLARLLRRNMALSGYSNIADKALSEDNQIAVESIRSDSYTKEEQLLKLEKELALVIERLVEKDEQVALLTKKLDVEYRSPQIPRNTRSPSTISKAPRSSDLNPFCLTWPTHDEKMMAIEQELNNKEKELKAALAVKTTLEDENRRLQAELQVFWREHFRRRAQLEYESYSGSVGTE